MSSPEACAPVVVLVVLALVAGGVPANTPALGVTVTPNEATRRVDRSIGGRPFTSYISPERLRKPVLYPLPSASGTLVTRGWPLDPRLGGLR